MTTLDLFFLFIFIVSFVIHVIFVCLHLVFTDISVFFVIHLSGVYHRTLRFLYVDLVSLMIAPQEGDRQ